LYLNKHNFLKSSFDLNLSKYNLNDNLTFRNFDFVERKLSYYKNNRRILKNIFKKNKKIEYYMSRFLKKLSKINFLNFLNTFEFSIVNVLLNSGFFLNKNDIFYFIKNKYIYINNKVITNINYEINKGDVVSLCYNKYYFFLYRKYLNNLNLNLNKYNNFFKKSSNLKNDFNFINKVIFIKSDIPNYLEVDYSSMSLILLYKNIINYNCFDLKLLTSFLKRLNT
jgi:ribosomal protein S4